MTKYLKVFEAHSSVDLPLDNATMAIGKMFAYYLPKKVEAAGCGKLMVFFGRQEFTGKTIDECLSIGSANIFVDRYDAIAAMPGAIERRAALLPYLMKGVLAFCRQYGADEKPFLDTAAEIEARGYVFADCFLPEKKNPARTFGASCCFEHEDAYGFYLLVRSIQDNATVRIPFMQSKAGHPLSAISSIKWDGNGNIRCFLYNGRDYWNYDLANGRLTFHFPRAENGGAHGQYDLAIMYLNGQIVQRDPAQAFYWLEKSAAQKFGRAVKLLEKLQAAEAGT